MNSANDGIRPRASNPQATGCAHTRWSLPVSCHHPVMGLAETALPSRSKSHANGRLDMRVGSPLLHRRRIRGDCNFKRRGSSQTSIGSTKAPVEKTQRRSAPWPLPTISARIGYAMPARKIHSVGGAISGLPCTPGSARREQREGPLTKSPEHSAGPSRRRCTRYLKAPPKHARGMAKGAAINRPRTPSKANANRATPRITFDRTATFMHPASEGGSLIP
jgi:hypothetical protein